MEVFNAPAPDFSCERREASTVTPQVFSLFNGQASYARAVALAARVMKETQSDEAAIQRCFLLAYGRMPNAEETAACVAHWRRMEPLQAATHITLERSRRRWKSAAMPWRENTEGEISFPEKLHVNADFVPDLQPGDVPVHTRALADVCLALFNSNEFCYVY